MLDIQRRFEFINYDDKESFIYLLNYFKSAFSVMMAEYSFAYEDVVHIQFTFRKILYSKVFTNTLQGIDDFLPNDMKRDAVKQSHIFGNNIIEDVKPLKVVLSDNVVSRIDVELPNEEFNFVDIVKEQNILLPEKHKVIVSDKDDFGLKYTTTSKPVIIKTAKIGPEQVKKSAYSTKGQLLSSVVDTLLPDGSLKRTTRNKTVFIKNDKIVSRSEFYTFKPVTMPPYNKNNKYSAFPNPNIGTFDLETYETNNIAKVYALGFHSNLQDKPITFYIGKDLDSDKIVIDCIKMMLQSKYSEVIWYCHNLGGFDSHFIINTLLRYNMNMTNVDEKPFVINSIFRRSKSLDVTISKVFMRKNYDKNVDKEYINEVRPHTMVIRDSYAIFTEKLKILCELYNVNTTKGDFPHKFAKDNTLFYIGNTPDFSNYRDVDKETYMSLYVDNWDFKKECIIYLEKDLLSLYEIIVSANRSVHNEFHVQLTNCLTASKLANDIYLKNYMGEHKIPFLDNLVVYNDIQKAYFGGISEVYIPRGKDLFYYDVNSLYPFSAYKAMPGLFCEYFEYNDKTIDLSDDHFGFYYCKVVTVDRYIGLLPCRTDTGVVYPTGSWEGWFFSEELKFAQNNGYIIKIIKGYNWVKEHDTFKDYVDRLAYLKANSEDVTHKNIAKLLLNSLFGRFGMSPYQLIRKIVNKNKGDNILLTRSTGEEIPLTNNHVLISYLPGPDADICKEFRLDYTDVLNSEEFGKPDRKSIIKGISIPTAATVTSYSRIHINKIKLQIINELKGKVYYSDTDSIITDVEFPDSMVYPSDIGKLKLESVL